MNQTTDQITHDNMNRVIQRQSDIAELIITQQNLSLPPAREITVHDGNPLTYHPLFRHLNM